jgi:hypothetical protein
MKADQRFEKLSAVIRLKAIAVLFASTWSNLISSSVGMYP